MNATVTAIKNHNKLNTARKERRIQHLITRVGPTLGSGLQKLKYYRRNNELLYIKLMIKRLITNSMYPKRVSRFTARRPLYTIVLKPLIPPNDSIVTKIHIVTTTTGLPSKKM